jgi:hypothetical protein
MIPIKQSAIAYCFEDVPEIALDLTRIGFMDETEAADAWSVHFDSRARHLFELPSDCWVLQRPWVKVGRWDDAYNGDAPGSEVGNAVITASGWPPDEPLLFVQNRQNIVSLDLDSFTKYWFELLVAFDDCPILMSRSADTAIAFCFDAMGRITQAHKKV